MAEYYSFFKSSNANAKPTFSVPFLDIFELSGKLFYSTQDIRPCLKTKQKIKTFLGMEDNPVLSNAFSKSITTKISVSVKHTM